MSLVVPPLSALAVHAHQHLAAHHDADHHDPVSAAVGLGHVHGPHGHHVHPNGVSHLCELRPELHPHSHSAAASVDHDRHEHDLRAPSSGFVLSRIPGPAPLLASTASGRSIEDRDVLIGRAPPGGGAGLPAEHGHLPVLHCSLLI